MKFLKFKKVFAISALTLALFTSCSDDDDNSSSEAARKYNEFHIAFASGTESSSASYVQGVTDLTTGTITSRTGYQLESSRTARIFVSKDAATLYSLNYTVGTIEKLAYYGGDDYRLIDRIDTSIPLGGQKTVRFTKINDAEGSVHYISATAQYDESGLIYQGHKMIANIGILDFETLTLKAGYNSSIEVNIDEDMALAGYYISRIDCPVLSGGKLYYGAALNKYNAANGTSATVDKTATLVVNYSDLTDTNIIFTDITGGSTNGYRTPTQHTNEAGEILQMVSNSTTNEVHIVKIKNGQYDESFDYNLSELLNKPATSNGWFYVGNGIGYIPYQDLTQEQVQIGVNPSGEPSYSAMWKLARMNFNNNTVVDLNVPDDLWLQQYQNSVVKDGKFFIALSPVGVDGNIYIFDINSDSPNGTLGASITGTGADQYYIGIY